MSEDDDDVGGAIGAIGAILVFWLWLWLFGGVVSGIGKGDVEEEIVRCDSDSDGCGCGCCNVGGVDNDDEGGEGGAVTNVGSLVSASECSWSE